MLKKTWKFLIREIRLMLWKWERDQREKREKLSLPERMERRRYRLNLED